MILGGRKIAIQRQTRVSNGHGGWEEAWRHLAYERGRIRPASTAERQIAGQEQAATTHIAYLRAGADIRFGDRLYLDEIGYNVTGCRDPGGLYKHMQIDLSMVQDGHNL